MMLQTKCGVRQSWASCFFLVHLGCLRLGMLEPWSWWNGLGLHLEGLNLDYDLLVFAWNDLTLHLEGMHLVSFWPLMLIMHIHIWWAQVLGLESFKKQIGLPFLVEFNLRLLGLSSFIAYKIQTIMMGSSVGLGLIMVQTMVKHMHNEMQFTWTNLKVGSVGHYNMGRW